MTFNAVLALVSLAGFATQRTLELLDPLFIFISKQKALAVFGDEKTAKTWCMALGGFGIGLAIALLDSNPNNTLPGLEQHTVVSDIVIALAISMGSNASNSLVKFGEHIKESRKKEVEPLPQLTVTPAIVTLSPNARMKFLASVTGTDNKRVVWEVLEISDGGTITTVSDGTGDYTAPARPGTYHVAAVSEANPLATATAAVTVKLPTA
jgi:hypothetical protein